MSTVDDNLCELCGLDLDDECVCPRAVYCCGVNYSDEDPIPDYCWSCGDPL